MRILAVQCPASNCFRGEAWGKGAKYDALMIVQIKSSKEECPSSSKHRAQAERCCIEGCTNTVYIVDCQVLYDLVYYYNYLSACYTYLWLLNDDVAECPTLTGLQRMKM